MEKSCEVKKQFLKTAVLVHSNGRNAHTSQVTAVLLFFMLFCTNLFASEIGTASYYGLEACKFNPHRACPTASGRSLRELAELGIPYAASWQYPMGTHLKVTNLANGKSVTVIILDRGPAKRLHRIIDLSKESFSKIADPKLGIIRVSVEVVHE